MKTDFDNLTLHASKTVKKMKLQEIKKAYLGVAMYAKNKVPVYNCMTTTVDYKKICTMHPKPKNKAILKKIDKHHDLDDIKWEEKDHWWCAHCGSVHKATSRLCQLKHCFTEDCPFSAEQVIQRWALSFFLSFFYLFLYFFIFFYLFFIFFYLFLCF